MVTVLVIEERHPLDAQDPRRRLLLSPTQPHHVLTGDRGIVEALVAARRHDQVDLVALVDPPRECPAAVDVCIVGMRDDHERALDVARLGHRGLPQLRGFTSRSFALKPSRSIVATSLSEEIFASSNSTRACAFSRLTSTFFTPGSLSKAAATEAWQALQTIPFTSMVATLDAACAVTADATKARRTRSPKLRDLVRRMDLLPSTGYMPAAM